jgi:hypothetical protein
MNVGIIDAELLTNGGHRFPNLAGMKLSTWHKERGDVVSLLPDYKYIANFDTVYICCVFTETAKEISPKILTLPNVRYGGTGFFFDKAPPLPAKIEHSPPDYNLYKGWLQGRTGPNLRYYTDYSLGFLTRGCFRRCNFCINRNCRRAVRGSSFKEFYDPNRKKVCLLDDNILAYADCEKLLVNLVKMCERDGKSFEFKQGLDIRLLSGRVAELLSDAPFNGEVIFAFDQMKDATAVRRGLNVLRRYLPTKGAKGYVLCGFENQEWKDIASVFRRLQVLWEFQTIGYVMRHEGHRLASPVCRPIYTTLARWANQPKFQRAMSFREFCEKSGGKATRTAIAFEKTYPDVAKEYFNMKYWDLAGKKA